MQTVNETAKDSSNQVVIENNTGTVNITNSSDTKLLERMIKSEEDRIKYDQQMYNMIQQTIQYAKGMIDMELGKSKKKNKK